MRLNKHIAMPLAAKIQKALASMLLLAFACVFSLRAEAQESVRVLFPFDSDLVSATYQDNTAAMARLDSLIGLAGAPDVEIITYSSPEGNWQYNQQLSKRRAVAMQQYLQNRHPALSGRISLKPGVESWEDLQRQISSDGRLTAQAREELLRIIGLDITPDEKERQLTARDDYKRLYAKYFKSLRYAEIAVRIENSAESKHVAPKSAITESAVTEESSGAPSIYYVLNEDFIRPGHMNNKAALAEIRKIFSNPANREKAIVIEGASSPDGPEAANRKLGMARAENLANWLAGQFPELEGRIVVRSAGENWEVLRAQVAACASLDSLSRAELLQIIDSQDTPAGKEARLKAHSAYDVVETECFPATRTARFAGFEPVRDTASAESESDSKSESGIDNQDQNDNQGQDDAVVVTPVIPITEEPVQTEARKDSTVKAPLFALTTNLLYEVGGAIGTGFNTVPLTVGYEIPVGKHWSIFSNYLVTTPWHAWNNNAECFELMHWDLGARWYPGGSFKRPFRANPDRRVLDGWYASLSAGCGYYDFEHEGKGYQGEEILGSVGIGYSICLDRHWSLNIGLGVGPLYTRYRYYEGRSNNEHLMYRYSGNFTYFGVTDAKVTLTYLIYYNRKVKK